MGIFSSIKNAIFGKKEEAPQVAPAAQPARATPPAQATQGQPAPQPEALEAVDVEARLDALPGADGLNWRGSIVDLLKLVRIDSSYENRKELAQELGNADYSGSAEDNIRLHRQTMKALAENGGKVPAEFID